MEQNKEISLCDSNSQQSIIQVPLQFVFSIKEYVCTIQPTQTSFLTVAFISSKQNNSKHYGFTFNTKQVGNNHSRVMNLLRMHDLTHYNP